MHTYIYEQIIKLNVIHCSTKTLSFFNHLCLTPLSKIFQLYHGDHFYWWRKHEYPKKPTDPSKVTDIMLYQVHIDMSGILLLKGDIAEKKSTTECVIKTTNISSHDCTKCN
jgi:hypothetical protein